MVIGSKAAFEELAQELMVQVRNEHVPKAGGWPPHLLELSSDSPYRDCPTYPISFNLEVEPLPAALRVKRRYATNGFALLAALVLSLIGLASIFRWVLHAL